ncbi:roadblock/LC7 domain-containing protein [Streptomyces sp. WMMB 322]|uniref:roadblock/LC7 domain-containing protein n=1 Tax=Streptomyces sp. WMMB 322 TaxID=1286821 RepID=UPI0006E37FD2|nr:roadblock/LC7 domain-containing protein [Streptomyces sp. WMMB 322]SCK24043.1 Predicted regulator of Ras-like GTPase activity, Roadblock/LC7/MglB family [Streptomyces sp. WMMB 322]
MTENPDAWMLNQVLDQPEVHDAILITADGLVKAFSPGLDQDQADSIAAALAGVQSTSSATAMFCRAPADSWRQSMVEFDGGFVVTIRAHDSTFLSVATSGAADVGQVAYRMHEVVAQLGREMGAELREDVGSGT